MTTKPVVVIANTARELLAEVQKLQGWKKLFNIENGTKPEPNGMWPITITADDKVVKVLFPSEEAANRAGLRVTGAMMGHD